MITNGIIGINPNDPQKSLCESHVFPPSCYGGKPIDHELSADAHLSAQLQRLWQPWPSIIINHHQLLPSPSWNRYYHETITLNIIYHYYITIINYCYPLLQTTLNHQLTASSASDIPGWSACNTTRRDLLTTRPTGWSRLGGSSWSDSTYQLRRLTMTERWVISVFDNG